VQAVQTEKSALHRGFRRQCDVINGGGAVTNQQGTAITSTANNSDKHSINKPPPSPRLRYFTFSTTTHICDRLRPQPVSCLHIKNYSRVIVVSVLWLFPWYEYYIRWYIITHPGGLPEHLHIPLSARLKSFKVTHPYNHTFTLAKRPHHLLCTYLPDTSKTSTASSLILANTVVTSLPTSLLISSS